MSEIMHKFPEDSWEQRISHYPWSDWSDGHVRRLIRGEDFRPSVYDFRATLHRKAATVGLKVRTMIDSHEDEEALIMQFYDPLQEDPSDPDSH